ncbi:MAG: hypothetical protein EXS36_13350 [Pedosphaera sp.]|nr:hypothetical protein [Pedosphaera sp.]
MNSSPSSEAVKVIYLPVMMVFCDKKVVPYRPEDFTSDYRSANGHLVCSHASLPKMKVTHLLDRRGFFHTLSPLKKRCAFLGYFVRVWDFTKMECSVSTAGPLKMDELLVEAKNWKNDYGRRLRRYLEKQNPEAIFDETQFRLVWESTLKFMPVSEVDWGKVLDLRK